MPLTADDDSERNIANLFFRLDENAPDIVAFFGSGGGDQRWRRATDICGQLIRPWAKKHGFPIFSVQKLGRMLTACGHIEKQRDSGGSMYSLRPSRWRELMAVVAEPTAEDS